MFAYVKCTNYLRRKYRKLFGWYYRYIDILLLSNKKFVIISNDCWGGSVYQWYKRPYNTPFVGLFIYAPCYIKLISNFDQYMKKDLAFINDTRYPDLPKTYPVALLGDIEIHFAHYHSEAEAREKWDKRTLRMFEEKCQDNYFFKFSDGARATDDHIKAFQILPYKNKLSFSIKELPFKAKNHVCMTESFKNNNKRVPNGVKLFKLTFIYFDLNRWFSNS